MKLSDVALFMGGVMILVPPVFELSISRPWYFILACLGGVLCAVSGYNAQAKMTGLGEPGEELLQTGWRWFKQRVLRRPVDAKAPAQSANPADYLVGPKPERSALSRGAFMGGAVLAAIPIFFGAALENKVAYTIVGVGCALMMIARRDVAPSEALDSPHGHELLQVWWATLKGEGKK